MEERDWYEWHAPYADPGSSLSRRLETVQRHVRDAVEQRPDGPVTILSLCAGQGHDVFGALVDHPRRADIRATLVELDERNVEIARRVAAASGLASVDVRAHDAGATDALVGAVPADVVLVCGVFGNVSQTDIERTVHALPGLCRPGATVIWTRHRLPPDLTPQVRGWFEAAGFTELAFDAPADTAYAVGAHRLRGEPRPFVPGGRLFSFVGFDNLL